MNEATHAETARARLRERLNTIRTRAERAASWASVTHHIGKLVGREGYVPLTARLSRNDLAFLAHARDDVLTFVRLELHLLELHQPRDAGAISSVNRPILRCRTCMGRWPCLTFKAIRDALPDDLDA